MSEILTKLSNRVLQISQMYHASHIGSCISCLPIIESIYSKRKGDEPFVLSNGHAALALYVVLENKYGIDAEMLFEKHGVHPNRDMENKIWYSTGSLGHGIGAAVGMAFADRDRKVYCIISDGESMEGSVWEALRIKTQYDLGNLEVHININGFTALERVNRKWLVERLKVFCPDIIIHKTNNPPGYEGVDGHYTAA